MIGPRKEDLGPCFETRIGSFKWLKGLDSGSSCLLGNVEIMQFGSRISRSGERFLFLGFCPGMIAALQFRDPCSVHVLYPSFLFIFFSFFPDCPHALRPLEKVRNQLRNYGKRGGTMIRSGLSAGMPEAADDCRFYMLFL